MCIGLDWKDVLETKLDTVYIYLKGKSEIVSNTILTLKAWGDLE